MPPTRMWKESDDMCIHLHTIPECDGQTDEQICRSNITVCMYYVLTRDKSFSLVAEQEQLEWCNICLDGPLTRFSRSRHF